MAHAGWLLATGTNSIDSDHQLALSALLATPAVAWLMLAAIKHLARLGSAPAEALLRSIDQADGRSRLIALLLLGAGLLHLGLVPAHGDEPQFQRLFVLNASAFALCTGLVFTWRWWRAPAIALTAATPLFYTLFVLAGRESVDQVGILAMGLELLTLGMLLLPRRDPSRQLAWDAKWVLATVTIVAVSSALTVGAWAATLRNGGGHQHDASPGNTASNGFTQVDTRTGQPTAADILAAQTLVAQTKADTAQYQNLAVAEAAGYRGTTPGIGLAEHFLNPSNMAGPTTLNPAKPESLVYVDTKSGQKLIGVLYITHGNNLPPPTGGPLIEWHRHDNICVRLTGQIAGFGTPFGTCPFGSGLFQSGYMVHVWLVPNPTGQFGDIDQAYLRQLANS